MASVMGRGASIHRDETPNKDRRAAVFLVRQVQGLRVPYGSITADPCSDHAQTGQFDRSCRACRRAYYRAWRDAHPRYYAERAELRRRARGTPTVEERKAATEARQRRWCHAGCGQPASPSRRYCAEHGPAALVQGPPEVECRHCREPLMQDAGRPGVGRLAQRFCSARCRLLASNAKGYRRTSHRKFPRIRGAQRRAVFERDHWTCGICHAVIDPALRWPHPGFPSIDHVDPAGAHEPANWQASHLTCNVEKGARAA